MRSGRSRQRGTRRGRYENRDVLDHGPADTRLIMAVIQRDSNVFRCLEESRTAVLHIVGDRQQEIAHRFFFPTHSEHGTINGEPFAEGRTAAPVLSNLPAHIECQVERIVDTEGDHAVVILRVVEAECREPVRPLTIAETPWQYGG